MMADDYGALLTAMGIDSANVLGWSDGGINGLLLAIRPSSKSKEACFHWRQPGSGLNGRLRRCSRTCTTHV